MILCIVPTVRAPPSSSSPLACLSSRIQHALSEWLLSAALPSLVQLVATLICARSAGYVSANSCLACGVAVSHMVRCVTALSCRGFQRSHFVALSSAAPRRAKAAVLLLSGAAPRYASYIATTHRRSTAPHIKTIVCLHPVCLRWLLFSSLRSRCFGISVAFCR